MDEGKRDRQTDRQTDRYIEREKEKDREREREREGGRFPGIREHIFGNKFLVLKFGIMWILDAKCGCGVCVYKWTLFTHFYIRSG